MSDEQKDNAFSAGRELADNFFKQAEQFSPRLVDELMELRREYLRAWSENVSAWFDFGEGVLGKLNLQPKVSSDFKNMARDLTDTWLKAEQEVISGAIGVSRSFVRATAAGTQAINAAGFRATTAAVDFVRARESDPKQAAAEVAEALAQAD